MFIRALQKAIAVPDARSPYDRIHLKIFYPADNSQAENPFASTPANQDLAPFPVVIFFNGFNCGLSMYQWLAMELAEKGLIVVLYDWLVETEETISLTPGVDLAAFSESNYGNIPSSLALPLLLKELDNLQSTGVLAGLLDLQTIILGGHSAGGRLALENAEPKLFERIAGAFSYGAHSASPMSLAKPGTILPLPDSLPMLLMGGTEDGVIAHNSQIYGLEQWSTPAEPVIRTFKEAIKHERKDSYLVIIEGANHFAIADPADPTLSVAEKDFPATQPEAEIRSLMASTIGLFIDSCILRRSQTTKQLEQLLETRSSAIALVEVK